MDADLFGSQHIPFPPSCLITIRAKVAPDTEEDLSYAVPLKGIESDIEIYINRSLETGMCCCTLLQDYVFLDSQDLHIIQQ